MQTFKPTDSMPLYEPSTLFTACYAKGHLNVRLRFGDPQHVGWSGDGVTCYWFTPGQRFAVSWWARLSLRRQVAGFAVAEALRVGDSGYRLPCIQPAVGLHAFLTCRCRGDDRGIVARADKMVREIQQADIDPCRVPPVYFRIASQALRVGRTPRHLDRDQLLRFLQDQSNEN